MFDLQTIFDSLYVLSQQYTTLFYIVVSLIVFLESALCFAIFLPGDSLLFFSGMVSAVTDSNIWLFELTLIIVATLGYQINFEMANWFDRQGIFHRLVDMEAYKARSHTFFRKHGFYSIIIARFVPIIRNVLPFVIGLSGMSRSMFLLANIVSAMLWILVIVNMAYFFGQIEWVYNHFQLCIMTVVTISCLPIFLQLSNRVYHSLSVKKNQAEQ
ncbi:MAG: cytochrome O ubiquinol oxidase [Legionellales bacterium]|nr:cytochrome O ubiquinol oxidase [Legionellales bacterium]